MKLMPNNPTKGLGNCGGFSFYLKRVELALLRLEGAFARGSSIAPCRFALTLSKSF